MVIDVRCPAGHAFKVPDGKAGTTAKCVYCGAAADVPADATPVAEAGPAPQGTAHASGARTRGSQFLMLGFVCMASYVAFAALGLIRIVPRVHAGTVSVVSMLFIMAFVAIITRIMHGLWHGERSAMLGGCILNAIVCALASYFFLGMRPRGLELLIWLGWIVPSGVGALSLLVALCTALRTTDR